MGRSTAGLYSMAAFVLKADVENRDDHKLAELEIEGMVGSVPISFADGCRSIPVSMRDRALELAVDEEHLILAPAPQSLDSFLRRSALISHVITGSDEAIEVWETVQTGFERSMGATGAQSRGLNPTLRRKNEYLSHSIHKYKAKFFPRMARSLINFSTPQDGTVLDPFVGSGTTCLEAALMGIRSVGVDIDPLSVEIARTKVDFLHVAAEDIRKAIVYFRTQKAWYDGGQDSLFSSEDTEQFILPEYIGRKLAQDIKKATEREIGQSQAIIGSCPTEAGARYLRIALSHAIATKISLRWMGTGDNRFSLAVAKRSVLNIMAAHLARIEAALENRESLRLSGHLGVVGDSQLEFGDARKLRFTDDSFDSVVTSPPYIPAASGRETYLRSRGPSICALGLMTEAEILEREAAMMGTILRLDEPDVTRLPADVAELVRWMMPQRARKPKAMATACYFVDLGAALAEMGRVTKTGGTVAMVVSAQHVFYELESRKVVRTLDMPSAVQELIAKAGNAIPLKLDRILRIQLPKMDFAARPASRGEYSEAVILMRKE